MEILSPLWHGFKTSLCIEQNKHFKYWSATIATKLHCPSPHLIKGTSSPPPSMCSVTLRQQGHAWIFKKHILQLLRLLKLSTKTKWVTKTTRWKKDHCKNKRKPFQAQFPLPQFPNKADQPNKLALHQFQRVSLFHRKFGFSPANNVSRVSCFWPCLVCPIILSTQLSPPLGWQSLRACQYVWQL